MGHKFGAYIVGPDRAAPFKEQPDQSLHCMLLEQKILSQSTIGWSVPGKIDGLSMVLKCPNADSSLWCRILPK